jgi:ubiquitin C
MEKSSEDYKSRPFGVNLRKTMHGLGIFDAKPPKYLKQSSSISMGDALTPEVLRTAVAAISDLKSVIDGLIPRIAALESAVYGGPQSPVSQPDESFQIFVKHLTGNQIDLHVRSTDRIEDIRRKIEDHPPDQQRLIFHGRELEDGNTLNDYGVGPGDSIYLVLRSRPLSKVPEIPKSDRFLRKTLGSFKIRVWSFNGYRELYVRQTDRISDIKLAVGRRSPTETRLLFNQKELHDPKTLGDYRIAPESLLDLVLRNAPDCFYGCGDMQFYVKTWTNKYIELNMGELASVEAVKWMIYDKLGFAPHRQRLIYAGRQLEDGNTLADYGIRKDSTVHLAERLMG